ncbi:MAG: peptidoglycan DD-metalloendopeptidase family protein [Candidatus Binatia bacterium]
MKHLRACNGICPCLLASAAGLARVAATAIVFVLCTPLLNPLSDDQELQRPQHTAAMPPPRVGVTLRPGDTLLTVLNRFGISGPSAHEMIEKVRPFLNLRRLRAGSNLQFVLHPKNKAVQGVEVVLGDSLVRVKASAEGWLADRRDIPYVRETQVVRSTVTDSLYQSGIHAGLTPERILDLARIFEYDIDFFSDFQPDDAFDVVVEEIRYADGRRELGRVLAAELEANGESFDAFYFVSRDGSGSYYDSQGRPMRRSFLRAPLSYVRISSPFSLRRRHPIFRTVRPHRAIDYAAPAGTPVVAVGRGRIVFSGWRNGYGNLVEIRHMGGYTSRYGHFSRIAAGIRRGVQIDQGDVVGYVGQTGHATGPHLHFEFLHNGEKINFLALKIPRTERLTGIDLQRFMRARDERLTLLYGIESQAKRTESSL